MTEEYKLPEWQQDENGAWYCEDDSQHLKAVICSLKKFDLPAFDNWIKSVMEWPVAKDMIKKRARLERALNDNSHELVDSLLENMDRAKRACMREDFLLPHARRGEKTLRSASEGGKARAIWPSHAEQMQAHINQIYSENVNLSYAEIKRKASKRHGYPPSALKTYTTNPKPKKPKKK